MGYGLTEINGRGPYTASMVPVLGSCINFPPPLNSCSIDTSAVVFDHGTVSRQSVGNVQRAQLDVTCNGTVAAKFVLGSGLQSIPLGESGQATITVDGKPLGTTIQMPNGKDKVSIESTLTVVPPNGEWTVSEVLIINLA